jgi:hypothetical protein
MKLADQLVKVDGAEMRIVDIPDQDVRAMFGYGHFRGHDREVIVVPDRKWPFTPDTCPEDERGTEYHPHPTPYAGLPVRHRPVLCEARRWPAAQGRQEPAARQRHLGQLTYRGAVVIG